jgi:hypothetical protein
MNKSNKVLSDVTAFRTYARYLSHLGRRESLEETINRNMTMHLDRFPKLSRDIVKAYQRVHELKVMPSMRSMQFAGEAILKNNNRLYNCSYAPIEDAKSFSEAMFLLLSGVGFGFSVQRQHVNRLPLVVKPQEEGIFVVHDSIYGWAQAVEVLMDSYFFNKVRPIFDFSKVRPKGSYLVTTGAKAPGPEPLRKALELVEQKLKLTIGRKLKSIECHDIICILSDAVLAGGVRRAACLSLFDRDDVEMLKAKHGDWWNFAPWRARSNNSAVLPRSEVTKEEFDFIFKMCQDSGSGEPGFSWSEDTDWGFNPSLRGSTRVWTKEFGIVPIKELEGKQFTVKNLYGTESSASCWLSSPKEKLFKITLSNGYEYFATKEHKWAVLTESGYLKLETTQLKAGMKLPRLSKQKIRDGGKGSRFDGVIVGYFYGDGWITDRKDTGKRQYGVCVPHDCERKQKYKELFSTLYGGEGCLRDSTLEFNSTAARLDSYFRSFGVDKKEKGLPEFLFREASEDFIDGFLEGFFDADGHLAKDGRTSFSTAHEKLANDLHDLLGFKGVYLSKTSRTKDHYVGANGKVYEKETHIYNLRRNLEYASNEKEAVVISVEETMLEEPVWDIRVDHESHCFQLAGCITGNCHEISLNPNQYCNLTTINQTGITSEKDFLNRVYAAALIGTLQASYTDFPFVRPKWKDITEKEALLGVSFTGIADANNIVTAELLEKGANLVKEVNEKYAKKLGINIAARTTAIKPEGTSSCILGSSSGIHARHSSYYIRRVRMNKDDALAVYLKHVIPHLVEDDVTSSSGVVVSIPQESPKGAIVREDETALRLLERALFYNKHWVQAGHRHGKNPHNVSVTISVKDNEWETLRESMWENRNSYSGISLLPYSDHTYKQAPFEECTKEQYEELSKNITEIDLKEVIENQDNTSRIDQLACVGGVCLIE